MRGSSAARRLALLVAALLAAGAGRRVGAGGAGGEEEWSTKLATQWPGLSVAGERHACAAYKLPHASQGVRAFVPEVTGGRGLGRVHHLAIYGCDAVYGFNEGDVDAAGVGQVPVPRKTSCVSRCVDMVSLYAWQPPAGPLEFPDDTASMVGDAVGSPYVILEAHLIVEGSDEDPAAWAADPLRAAITLHFSRTIPTRVASAIVIANSSFALAPQREKEVVLAECCMPNTHAMELHAMRVHAHAWGRRVALTVDGSDVYDGDPRQPQAYRSPAGTAVKVSPFRKLGARCEYDTRGSTTPIHVGMSATNEMCCAYPMLLSHVPIRGICNGKWGLNKLDPQLPTGKSRRPVRGASEHGAQLLDTIRWDGMGQASAVVAAYRGDRNKLLIFHRLDRMMAAKDHAEPLGGATLSVWDESSGRVVETFGAGIFPLPHGLAVDTLSGDVWTTDVDAQAAVRLSHGGNTKEVVLGNWGRRATGSAGARGPGVALRDLEDTSLCRPTSAVVAADGRVYVSDGYCAARVVVYAPVDAERSDYRRERVIDLPGAIVPHALVLDECKHKLYVAGREDKQIHVVDLRSAEAKPLRIDTGVYGRVFGLTMDEYGQMFALTLRGETSQEARGRPSSPSVSIVWFSRATAMRIGGVWDLGSEMDAPHDLAVTIDVATGDRLAYVAETKAGGTGAIRKYRLLREDRPEEARTLGAGGASKGGQDASAWRGVRVREPASARVVRSDGGTDEWRPRKEPAYYHG